MAAILMWRDIVKGVYRGRAHPLLKISSKPWSRRYAVERNRIVIQRKNFRQLALMG
ncbi:MAG: hypothetical protein WB586_12840 [Chthoniobacterales bacterium]